MIIFSFLSRLNRALSRLDLMDHGKGRRLGSFAAGLAAAYLVLALLLAHTAYIAVQGRTAASAGLQASRQSFAAFNDFKGELRELHQLVDTVANAALRSTSSIKSQASRVQQSQETGPRATHAQVRSAAGAASIARVQDSELHHVTTHGNVCDKHEAAGLSLNVTEHLVAPLVIMGHNRPGYLAKSVVSLLK